MESYINSLLGTGDGSGQDSDQKDILDNDPTKDQDLQQAISSEESDALESQVDETARPLLPFPFAKRCGGFVLDDGIKITLYHKETIGQSVVAEIQRHLGVSFICEAVKESRFDGLLAQAYES
ncbi:MAG TPA: hypothetical protein DHT34_03965, partial [Cellvibrionales bacterium]|nr:hypothetical protein [Cellvibrionales bacterium]